MVARRIEAKVDWKKLDKLDVLGVDENALKKGHTDFVTIVTARVDGQLMVLAVLADRTVPENSRILTCRLECSPGSSPSQVKDRQIRHPEQQNADSWAQADFFGPSCSMAS